MFCSRSEWINPSAGKAEKQTRKKTKDIKGQIIIVCSNCFERYAFQNIQTAFETSNCVTYWQSAYHYLAFTVHQPLAFTVHKAFIINSIWRHLSCPREATSWNSWLLFPFIHRCSIPKLVRIGLVVHEKRLEMFKRSRPTHVTRRKHSNRSPDWLKGRKKYMRNYTIMQKYSIHQLKIILKKPVSSLLVLFILIQCLQYRQQKNISIYIERMRTSVYIERMRTSVRARVRVMNVSLGIPEHKSYYFNHRLKW